MQDHCKAEGEHNLVTCTVTRSEDVCDKSQDMHVRNVNEVVENKSALVSSKKNHVQYTPDELRPGQPVVP